MPDFNHTATTNTSIYSERLWIPRSGHQQLPTRSLGMIRSSEPCFRKTFPTQPNKNAKLGCKEDNISISAMDTQQMIHVGSPSILRAGTHSPKPRPQSSSGLTDQQVLKREGTPATVKPANAAASTNGGINTKQ